MLSGGGISQFDRANRAAPVGRRSYESRNGCSASVFGWQGRVVGAQSADKAIDIEFDGVGAYVADGQEAL